MKKKIISFILIFTIILSLIGCSTSTIEVETPPNNTSNPKIEVPELVTHGKEETGDSDNQSDNDDEYLIAEDGKYSTPEDVALYIHLYGKLPSNFLTKKEAMDLGWESDKGNLWDVTDNKSIGGDRFGNREGLLPNADGRIYFEADVNYKGGFRGAERIVFSNDGLIFYTKDHYDSFEQLY